MGVEKPTISIWMVEPSELRVDMARLVMGRFWKASFFLRSMMKWAGYLLPTGYAS